MATEQSLAAGCPGVQKLSAFNRGELPAPDSERLAEHLSGCSTCQSRLADMPEHSWVGRLRGGMSGGSPAEPECQMLEERARAIDLQAQGPATVPPAGTVPQNRAADDEVLLGKFGPYELLEKLGHGGMGIVYKARQMGLKRIEALKMVPGDADTDAQARFRVEAEAVARLKHANVVQVYGPGEHEGRLYFAMEYLPGGTLAGQLAGGALDLRGAAKLVAAIARGVQAAHEANVIHRDLKPSNVLFAADGTPKVTDFGLAKLTNGASAVLTHTNAVIGTAAYMAPEQAGGGSRAVGAAADVYSLGAILYECLTGRRPFQAPRRDQVLELVQTAEPARPSGLRRGLSRDLEAVCLKCLEKHGQARYGTAKELADDLERWLRGEPTRARPRGPMIRTLRRLRRQSRRIAVVLLAVVLIGLGTVVWRGVEEGMREPPDPDRIVREFQARLARGKRVVLVGPTGGPQWHRWVTGQEAGQMHASAKGPLTVHASNQAMLELMPDPGIDRYRLWARVRHFRAHKATAVGIYFARFRQPTSQGEVDCYGQLIFDDITDPVEVHRAAHGGDPEPPRLTWSNLIPRLSLADVERRGWNCPAEGLHSGWFAPAGAFNQREHDLEVKVTPEGVRGFWDGQAMEAYKETMLPAGRFVHNSRKQVMNLAQTPLGRIFARELRLDFAPRGGLGLWVNRASASYSNVVLEPLTNSD
jgi:serine/threonine-protein kinase